uniref:Uncharacterized protein n=1 Tax=Anguilla anguilla TaxID=7936 RepID=A0A0E9QI13_ANGAN
MCASATVRQELQTTRRINNYNPKNITKLSICSNKVAPY